MATSFSGGCACGAIRYTCIRPPSAMYNCHCACCRHASGAACVALLIVAAGAVQLTGSPRFSMTGDDSDHPYHGFCTACGASVLARSEHKDDLVLIKAASLDDSAWFVPVADIWTAQALPWAAMDRHIPKVFKTPPLLEKPNAVTT